jgi:hypothetical protein
MLNFVPGCIHHTIPQCPNRSPWAEPNWFDQPKKEEQIKKRKLSIQTLL